MTRQQLLDLLRAALPPEQGVQIVIVGSQSVLGAHPDRELPERATMSMEADVMYRRNGVFDNDLTEMADAVFGEGSDFHTREGVYLQGVDEMTCVLPDGWEARLVTLAVLPARVWADGRSSGDVPVLCLDPHDLAVAKLAAGRPKDVEFVHALIRSGHLDGEVISQRAGLLDSAVHPGRRSEVTLRLRTVRRSQER